MSVALEDGTFKKQTNKQKNAVKDLLQTGCEEV